ncbi:MAG: formylglycine-generating enzyme family protein, partial [Prevotellaceae bacterium]|nr:formylglycine-generating enzyme family protein [Prevotellaceae bacterium]
MRKILFTICLTLYCAFVNAQSMSVSSFTLDESDLTANLQGTTVLDQNGEKCALIKIVTTAKGLTFDVGVLGVRKVDTSHSGEVWLYVPYGVRKMTINHQQYGQIRDYVLPENVERARTYVMKLKVEDGPNKTQMLTVMYKPQNAIVVIDNKIVRGSNGTVTAKLPVGSHQYQILADGYDTEEGVVNIKPTSPSKLIIELTRTAGSVEVVAQPQQQQQPQLAQPEGLLPITVNNITFNMVKVEGGTFDMGATAEQGSDATSIEKPVHQVTLSPYYIGQTEVTQALWMEVMGDNPSKFKGDNNPVENISWKDCQKFITQLNQMTGKTFRMLTEAEWEYAARGGNK